MESPDLTDKPKITAQDSIDKIELQRKLQDAPESRPGAFRYSDMELGGEVRTSTDRQESFQPIATTEVFDLSYYLGSEGLNHELSNM